jgi:hypothetical protein
MGPLGLQYHNAGPRLTPLSPPVRMQLGIQAGPGPGKECSHAGSL